MIKKIKRWQRGKNEEKILKNKQRKSRYQTEDNEREDRENKKNTDEEITNRWKQRKKQ